MWQQRAMYYASAGTTTTPLSKFENEKEIHWRNTLKMYYVSAGTATTPLSRFEIGKESHCKYISGMFQKF